ncbi:MAG TPA: hypothetical protein VGS27_30255 [Candidatus Sulfotelmatobacter sp.]|nr:hypothetical protein [Candidatus Sulfotelmatobacter sp.]
MTRAFKTIQRVALSAFLMSAIAAAQAPANNSDNTKSTQHHSKLSKAAFWRHNKDASKNAKQEPAKPAASKQTPVAKQDTAKATTSKPAQPSKQNTPKAATAKKAQPSKQEAAKAKTSKPAAPSKQSTAKATTPKSAQPSKQAQAKKAEAKKPHVKPATAKQFQTSKAQVKPVSAKQTNSTNTHKQTPAKSTQKPKVSKASTSAKKATTKPVAPSTNEDDGEGKIRAAQEVPREVDHGEEYAARAEGLLEAVAFTQPTTKTNAKDLWAVHRSFFLSG